MDHSNCMGVHPMVAGVDGRAETGVGDADKAEMNATDTAKKTSRKELTGLSCRSSKEGKRNVSVVGKSYNQSSTGAIATTTTSTSYTMPSESVNSLGYGIAGKLFLWDLQEKLSYERASRLPSADALFGDQDLELGDADLKPESSHNYNVGLSYYKSFGRQLS